MSYAVSVIIPTYNRPRWLRQAIESVLQQTHPLVEVLVVDDGSRDHAARDITLAYPGVRYIYQQNRGLGAARNAGIQACSGDYVAFLDDDDWLMGESLSARLEAFVAHPDTG